jgi:hypothetical protein
MKRSLVTFALGTALALCVVGNSAAPAYARKDRILREPQTRIIVRPLARPVPYWDSNIVPRYRYRPEDDRIDPYGPPVVPVLRDDGGWL